MVDIASIIVAVVSLVGAAISAGVAAWATFYSENRKRLSAGEILMAKYRDPLLLAARDLQSKLYNIMGPDKNLLTFLDQGRRRRQYVYQHTAFVFGQYFSWVYILRREAQFLRFPTDRENRMITHALAAIEKEFLTSRSNDPFMIWKGEQQALGELMTVEEEKQHYCMGYATFCARWREDTLFRRWFDGVSDGVTLLHEEQPERRAGVDQRLRRLQHLLVDLIEIADPKGLWYDIVHTQRCVRAVDCQCRSCRLDEESKSPVTVSTSAF
ncbi:hypothetical protein K439DRAFT_1631206 [Ramaria rubella]|nr:hypothetical protein K439DRAFT_1631206 [Ramaria rubella]